MVALLATSLAGGLQLILFATFSLIVGLTRAGTGIMYGYRGEGNTNLEHLVRAQGNVAEYGSYIILAFFLTEYNQLIATSTLNNLAIAVFIMRLGHGLRVALPDSVPVLLRVAGFLGTCAVLFWLGGLNIAHWVASKS